MSRLPSSLLQRKNSRGWLDCRAARSTGCGAVAPTAFLGNMNSVAVAANIGVAHASSSLKFKGGWTLARFGELYPGRRSSALGAKLRLDVSLDVPPGELAATVLLSGRPLPVRGVEEYPRRPPRGSNPIGGCARDLQST